MAGCLVVLAMADLPREVWNQKNAVTEEAGDVVECFGWRERLVAALMSHDPQTGTDRTLHEGVDAPESESKIITRNILWC